MPRLAFILLLASCGGSAPLRTTIPPGVHPDITHHGACRLDDGTFAAEGVTADLGDDCNECTCRPDGWECTERDC